MANLTKEEQAKFKESYAKMMEPVIGKDKVSVGTKLLLRHNYRIIKGVADVLDARLDTWWARLPVEHSESVSFRKIQTKLKKRIAEIRVNEITP